MRVSAGEMKAGLSSSCISKSREHNSGITVSVEAGAKIAFAESIYKEAKPKSNVGQPATERVGISAGLEIKEETQGVQGTLLYDFLAQRDGEIPGAGKGVPAAVALLFPDARTKIGILPRNKPR